MLRWKIGKQTIRSSWVSRSKWLVYDRRGLLSLDSWKSAPPKGNCHNPSLSTRVVSTTMRAGSYGEAFRLPHSEVVINFRIDCYVTNDSIEKSATVAENQVVGPYRDNECFRLQSQPGSVALKIGIVLTWSGESRVSS